MKNVAVIGYGGQGKWHCLEANNCENTQLKGIYDIKEERILEAKNNGVFTYSSNEEIFADKNIDIVVVATPNDVHEELCVKALESGHHVICEKPVTLSVESFERILKASQKSGKVFSVYQNRRWDSEYVGMKNLITSDKLGRPIRIESRVHGSRGIPGDWRKEKKHGGGMLYDWGVHLIDQMLMLIPETIVEINCYNTHITNAEVDDGFKLELLFESGITAFVEVATYNFVSLPRFYAQFENGTCVMEDWNKNIKVCEMTKWVEKNIIPVKTSSGITKTMAPRDNVSCENYEIQLPDTDVHEFYKNYCDTIDGTSTQHIKNSEVKRVLQVIESAFESNEVRQRLRVKI